MRKILIIAALVVLAFASNVFADRNTPTITGYSSSTLVKRGDWKIYRVTFLVTAAGGTFTIYDGLVGGDNSNIKTEGAEAVDKDGKLLDFTAKPLEGSTGLYLVVVNCDVIIEYE